MKGVRPVGNLPFSTFDRDTYSFEEGDYFIRVAGLLCSFLGTGVLVPYVCIVGAPRVLKF